MNCKGITKSGKRCKAIGLVKGTEFCMVHAPELRDKMLEAKSKGGKTTTARKIRSLSDYRKLMEDFISNEMKSATPSMISAVAKMSESYTKLIEKDELEARMRKLEAGNK